MSAQDLILDFDEYDLRNVVADTEEIRRYNPQRYEFEQLTAICFDDRERQICVGYQDQLADSFWIRGHMPNYPLLPGVLILESAAQVCSYFSGKHDLLGAKLMGFGGVDGVRFRERVVPGQRLVTVLQVEKVRRGAMIVSRFQSFVDQNLVCEGLIRGVPLSGGY